MITELCHLTYYRGRVALTAILKGLGVSDRDSVAIQAFTCLAVPEGVMAAGARPVYIDIEPGGYNMNPDHLQEKISSNVKAIIVQHTFGIPAQMDAIVRIANENGIPIIEDCCHSFMSSFMDQRVGSFGVASFYSFEWGKPIVVGLGGSALVNDPVLRKRLETSYSSYSNPGMIQRAKLELQYCGFGCLYWPRLFWPVRFLFHSLSKLGAAEGNFNDVDDELGIAPDFSWRLAPHMRRRLARKAAAIDQHTAHSTKVTEAYRSRIINNAIHHPLVGSNNHVVYARYPLQVAEKQLVLQKARKNNVELAAWYTTPIHPLSGNALSKVHYKPGSCPNAELRANEVVSLPTHRRVSDRYIDRAVKLLNQV